MYVCVTVVCTRWIETNDSHIFDLFARITTLVFVDFLTSTPFYFHFKRRLRKLDFQNLRNAANKKNIVRALLAYI